ncbi:MAG: ferredoxin [Yoonia sp.]|nr:ferredoxin [Yoonia sp.]
MTLAGLADVGLMSMGHCSVLQNDGLDNDHGALILLGPDEPAFWRIFSSSPEYRDGHPHPMDRWSRRVIDVIAEQAKGVAYYPFGGPPFQPFYSWAIRSGRAWASPIGFLVHDIAGLFASYRGAVWVPEAIPADASRNPCPTCHAPCKTACPVDALRDTYDVAACKTYIASAAGTACMTTGCAARRSCPVGASRRLPAQAAFHMEAFL